MAAEERTEKATPKGGRTNEKKVTCFRAVMWLLS